MSLITINPELCKKEGFCTRICQKVFSQEVRGSVPIVTHEEFCNSCGHCVMICPAGAITQADSPPERLHPVLRHLIPPYEQVRELVAARRSTRTFQQKDVEREVIEKVIEGARFAPSAKNTQSTQLIVIQDRSILHTIAATTATWLGNTAKKLKNPVWRRLYLLRGAGNAREMTRWIGQFELIAEKMREHRDLVLFDAPVLLLFYADSRVSFAEVNASLALQNSTIVASSLGLGSFFTGYVVAACSHNRAMRQLLELPKNNKIYGGLAIGYPEIQFPQWIERGPGKIRWM